MLTRGHGVLKSCLNQTKVIFFLAFRHQDHWEHVPEKVPELVVPDLTGFELKPYVSYAAEPTEQVINSFIEAILHIDTDQSIEQSSQM